MEGKCWPSLLIDHVSILLQELTEVTLDAQQTQAWDQLRCMYRGPSRVRHIMPTHVPTPTLSAPSLDIIPSNITSRMIYAPLHHGCCLYGFDMMPCFLFSLLISLNAQNKDLTFCLSLIFLSFFSLSLYPKSVLHNTLNIQLHTIKAMIDHTHRHTRFLSVLCLLCLSFSLFPSSMSDIELLLCSSFRA